MSKQTGYRFARPLKDIPITSRRLTRSVLLMITVNVTIWLALLCAAFVLVLGRGWGMMPYYFSVMTTVTILGVLGFLLKDRPTALMVFLGLSIVTFVLLLEEALLNGLHRDAGVVLAFIAAFALPLAGSILRLTEKTITMLSRSIEERLDSLGDGVGQILLRHVEKEYSLKVDDMVERPESFMEALRGIFGAGAFALEKAIVKTVLRNMRVGKDDIQTGRFRRLAMSLRHGADAGYALQVAGLVFASRLVFIPFPQDLLSVKTAPPSMYALIVSLVFAFLIVKRIDLRRIGLTVGSYPMLKQVSAGVSIGLVSGLLEYFILRPDPILPAGDSLQSIVYVIIVMTLFVGLTEEVLFRGLLQESYQKVLPASSAILMASLQFGIMHYGWLNPLEILCAYSLGIVFGYLFWKTKSLLAPVIAHSLGNITLFIAAAYADVMLTPDMTRLTIIMAVVLLLPVVPWRSWARARTRSLPEKVYLPLGHARLGTPSLQGTFQQTQIGIDQTTSATQGTICSNCSRILSQEMKYCDRCGQEVSRTSPHSTGCMVPQ